MWLHPDGNIRKTGLIPRDYSKVPHGHLAYAPAFNLPLVPRDQWATLIAQKDAANSWLDSVRDAGNFGKPIPSLDQNGCGYCWAHSSTHCVMLVRALNNQPYVPLSAYMVAAIIKGGADEGGNGIDSLEFIAQNGICDQKLWPQGNRNVRSLDTPACRADAKLHVCQEWMDLDPSNMESQLVTCLLNDIPVVFDSDGWGHSICAVRVKFNGNKIDTKIWNSWGDAWQSNGMGWISEQGYSAIPDGAVAPRVITGSLT